MSVTSPWGKKLSVVYLSSGFEEGKHQGMEEQQIQEPLEGII